MTISLTWVMGDSRKLYEWFLPEFLFSILPPLGVAFWALRWTSWSSGSLSRAPWAPGDVGLRLGGDAPLSFLMERLLSEARLFWGMPAMWSLMSASSTIIFWRRNEDWNMTCYRECQGLMLDGIGFICPILLFNMLLRVRRTLTSRSRMNGLVALRRSYTVNVL